MNDIASKKKGCDFIMKMYYRSETDLRSNGDTIKSRMGVNIDLWQGSKMFADAMKMSLYWQEETSDGIKPAKIDENGWPVNDARITVLWQAEFSDVGVYQLSFETKSNDVLIEDVCHSFKVQNQNSHNGITTAEIVLTNSQPVIISFSNTSGGVRNVKLLRPGYNGSDIFTKSFLEAIKPFSTIRFMEFLKTNEQNGSYERDECFEDPICWKDRKRVTDASQITDIHGRKGGAWEYIVALCNLTGKDAWINVPYNAEEDYMIQLANFLKENLRDDCNIYVEYSNEVWNLLFPHGRLNFKLSGAEHWTYKYVDVYAEKMVRMAELFKCVFGNEAINHRIRIVAGWQICHDECDLQSDRMLQWIDERYGNPSEIIYALAWAPYMREPSPTKCVNVNTILSYFHQYSDFYVSVKNRVFSIAKKYNLVGGTLSFEGGTRHGARYEEQLKLNMEVRNSANRDPRITELLMHDLKQNWFQLGGGLFCYYNLASAYGESGRWGLTENIEDLSQPKYQAILKLVDDESNIPLVSPAAARSMKGE